MLNFLKFIFPDFTFYFGGGGGGPTTTKSETTNIPDYARPYVERMMGSTEKQVYTYGDNGQITGFQPYKPFEGETVAGFTPTQSRAMQGIQNYQLPGQTNAASQMTGYAGLGSMGAGQQYAQQATNPYATQAYMSPYMQNALEPQMREAARQSAIMGQQNQAQAVQQGAFGGSRSAIVEAERQRNLGQQQADIYGRGMQSAFEQARQAQQFGSELGLKGYGQGLQAAGQLGALGQQQYGQEMGLLGQQMEVGGKQQAYEQARLNQRIQDYATQQQYPFIQLGTLSNMLRGLPMQASTTQMYQAQPPLMQQAVGLAGAGANLYQAFGGKQAKEGGEIKEMASGGIATGADPYKLPGMMKKLSDDQLKGKLGGDTDPETMGIAQAEKQRRDQTRAGVTKMAGGGAVAFKKGGIDTVDNPFTKNEVKPEEKPAPAAKAPAAKAPAAKAPAPAPAPTVSATPYQDQFRAAMTGFAPPPEVEKTRANIKELEGRVAAGVTGELDRQQKAYDKLGIDPVKMFEEERARRQEEMKMSKEDARKSEHLRWAQMFAKFGSTPGPVLKAALVAINDTVPDLLDDQAKASAIQREANKALNDLNRAEFLEKKGRVDDALKSHNAAAEKAATLSANLGEMLFKGQVDQLQISGRLAGEEVQTEGRLKAEKIQADARIKAEGIQAAGNLAAARERNKGDDKRDEREQRKREDTQTRNARAEYNAYINNKDRIAEIKELNRRAGLKDPKSDIRIAAEKRLAEMKRQEQDYIRGLPKSYPDARIDDLIQESNADNATSPYSPGVQAALDKYK
jgi:hypothetical protein